MHAAKCVIVLYYILYHAECFAHGYAHAIYMDSHSGQDSPGPGSAAHVPHLRGKRGLHGAPTRRRVSACLAQALHAYYKTKIHIDLKRPHVGAAPLAPASSPAGPGHDPLQLRGLVPALAVRTSD